MTAATRPAAHRAEVGKVVAFLRRDLLTLLSYRTAFLTDWLGLVVQVVLFSFVSRLVDPATLPTFGGAHPSYLEFVTVGIAVSAFMNVGLSRVMEVVRSEQMTGTLETLLLSPSALGTVLVGSTAFQALYVPVRIGAFLALVGVVFDVSFAWSSLPAAIPVVTAFVPVVWGLGLVAAALVLTFRRGGGAVGALTAVLGAASGAYFPVTLLPGWAQWLMQFNPVTLTLTTVREVVLGGAGWSAVLPVCAILIGTAVGTVTLGVVAFRLALRREVRRGTLHLY